MESVFLEFDAARIHCLRFGSGPNLLVAFHGYGDRADFFRTFEPALAERYTVYAPDLPFHGRSMWPQDSFRISDLEIILRRILALEHKQRFTLAGFSFGARLALGLLPTVNSQLDGLILLSPDGIRTRGLSAAARAPAWLRRALRALARRPDTLLRPLRLAERLGLIGASELRFAALNLATETRIRRLFGCWSALIHCSISPNEAQRILRTNRTPVEIYYGIHDPILRSRDVENFASGIPTATAHALNAGHIFELDEAGNR